ncbi:uncharacterized protein LOC107047930 [Diachasma alloeum]|uniref:uncharacterized protein LOC107047930 n=1 Tax=Diachasma alloeum TaxID=454923 RepID=UPI0007381909|nr:uncharacterized protein LOC107047930 [Diachasma alloeum]
MDYGGNVSDASEDIFSDDDEPSDVSFTSPDPKVNTSFFNLSQTPVLLHHQREETPGKPIVPKTPLTLAPFISKADDWTSDMETPQGKRDLPMRSKNAVLDSNNVDDDLTQTAEPVLTPAHLRTDETNEEIVPLSQELPPRKKQKRVPKRRIFDKNNTNFPPLYEDDDSDEVPQHPKARKSQSLIVAPQSKSPLQKLEKLKALQKRMREKKGLETLTDDAIPDDEFLRSCRDLEMCDRLPQRGHIEAAPTRTSPSRDSTEESPLTPTWKDLETQQQETVAQATITQETVALTPPTALQTIRQDTYSQIDLGIDHIEEEDDDYLEKTFTLEGEEIEIKKEMITIEEPEDGFRGFSKAEQESKELWEFQRIFVLQYGGLSPKKLNFPGFSFVEEEIAKTISQNNDIFLNNYLEKYYGIRKQVDPLVITIDTESEESQPTEEIVPQLQLLPPLLMPVYSGFDTASGNKLFISVDKIFEEKTKLQRDEPTEMHSIDLLMNNQASTKVQTSIYRDKESVQILEDKSRELIKPSDKSADEKRSTADENIEDNVTNRDTSLITSEKCDKIVPPPLKIVESVSKGVEQPHKDDFPGCVGFQTLGKTSNKPEEPSRVDNLFIDTSSKDYTDCLNEISNLKKKRRSLRLNRVESAPKSSPMTKATIVNQSSNDNCDPKPSRTSPSPRVPDPHDERQMNPEVPRDMTPGCENNSIPPAPVDSPQLRNTNYSPVPIDPQPNGQFPGFVTGTGRTVEISEKAWSMGLAMFGQAGKEVAGDAEPSAPVESTLKKLNSVVDKPFTPLRPPDMQNPAATSKSSAFPSKPSTAVNIAESECQSTPNTSNPIVGFKTGSGAPINLSEAAQTKIKVSMQEFSLNLEDEDPDLLELSSMKRKMWARRRETTEKIPLKKSTGPPLIAKPFTLLNTKKPETTSTSSTFVSMQEFSPNLEDEDPDLLELSSMKRKMWARRRETTEKIPLKKSTGPPLIAKPFTLLNTKKPETTSTSSTFVSMQEFSPNLEDEDPDLLELSSMKRKMWARRRETTEKIPLKKSTGPPLIAKPFTLLNTKKPETTSTSSTFVSMQEFSPNLEDEDPDLLELSSMKRKMWARRRETTEKIPLKKSTGPPLIAKPFTLLNTKKPETTSTSSTFVSMQEFSPNLEDEDPDLLELSSMKRKMWARRRETTEKIPLKKSTGPPLIAKPFTLLNTKKPETTSTSSTFVSMQEFSPNLEDEDPDLLELSSMKRKMWARRRETTEKIPLKKSTGPPLIAKPFTLLNTKKPETTSTSSTFVPALGFTTAGGGAIKLSEAALEQMKAGLEAYTADVHENDLDFSDLKKKVSTVQRKKLDPSGDDSKTSRGAELPPKRTSLPFISKPFTPLNVRRPEIRPNSTPITLKSTCGFTTAGGGGINLSEAVQRKIQADLKAYNTEVDENEPVVKNNSTNSRNENPPDSAKRKNPSDDVTPFGRKRARTAGTDLQARILFHEINEEDDEIIQSSLALENNRDTENDRILPFKNTVSEEMRASCERPSSRWSDSSYLPSTSSRPIERRPYSFPTNPSTEKSKTDKKLTNQELIPDDVVFDSQEFLESYEKISTKIKLNEALERKRNEAIAKQENLIEAKRKNRARQNPGSLVQIKEKDKSLMISLEQLCFPGTSLAPRDPREFPRLKIDPAVATLTSSTSENYQFNLEEIYRNVSRTCVEGISVGDGALLIPNEHNLAGITEFKRSFLASPGVDPTLLPDNWVENHYKWIVWKLGSMDRLKFTRLAPPKCLTPDRVLKQLKYRYDREIDRAERPVIRRILEKDDAPSRRMILCVSRIKRTTMNKETTISMELTDGWYSVVAALDTPMINNILSGKIKEGTKLMTYGSQLMNIEEGCHPLEAPSTILLKINTNSTRRVKWYTKLGLQKYSGPMELSLRHIHPNGGLIGKVSAVVSRIYPIIYRETTSDGQVIFRNARSEERAQMSFTKNRDSVSTSSTLRDVRPCLKIRITDGCAHGVVTIWQNAEECSEMFKEGNSISIIHGIASGKRSSELQINATRWTTFDVRMCGKKFSFPERIFTPLSDTMTQGFSPNYGEFDTVGIVVSIGPAPHGMKNFETVYLAYRSEKGEDSFLSILFWEGVVAYGYSDIATIGSIVCCINCEWRRNTYRSIPTAFCSERTIITRNPRQGSHLRSEFDGLRHRIGDTSNYVDDCAARIHAEVMKKSGSVSVTPGRSVEVTPRDRRSTAIKGRLEKLQGYEPMPKLSPINLAGSSRVSLDFKSPLARSNRTESGGRR